jgi:hypothetical protein
MTARATCLTPDVVNAVRVLYDSPQIVVVCRECLETVLRRGTLRPADPTLRVELDATVDDG